MAKATIRWRHQLHDPFGRFPEEPRIARRVMLRPCFDGLFKLTAQLTRKEIPLLRAGSHLRREGENERGTKVPRSADYSSLPEDSSTSCGLDSMRSSGKPAAESWRLRAGISLDLNSSQRLFTALKLRPIAASACACAGVGAASARSISA